ncbi:MAG: hypothetical protein ACM3ZA_09800, partial [Bacillota bacterium]
MLAFIRRLLRPRRATRTLILTLAVAVLLLIGCRSARRPDTGTGTAKSATLGLAQDADVQRAFADGRRALLTQNGVRDSFLQQNVAEQKSLAADPRYLPDLLRLQMDLMEKMGSDPTLEDRVRAANLKVFRDLARDPKYRPQLIAIMIDLLRDPQLASALKSMGGAGGPPP